MRVSICLLYNEADSLIKKIESKCSDVYARSTMMSTKFSHFYWMKKV